MHGDFYLSGCAVRYIFQIPSRPGDNRLLVIYDQTFKKNPS